MSSSDFLPKNRPLFGRPDRSANQRPGSVAGNYLNSCPDFGSQKNLPLLYLPIYTLLMVGSIYSDGKSHSPAGMT